MNYSETAGAIAPKQTPLEVRVHDLCNEVDTLINHIETVASSILGHKPAVPENTTGLAEVVSPLESMHTHCMATFDKIGPALRRLTDLRNAIVN